LPPTLLWAGGLSFTGQTGESSLKMDVKLYVGNLAKSTTEDELKTLFTQTGPVALVEVIKDRDSGQSKGFAFITMNDQAQADNAITKFNGYSFGEHELKVNIAKPKVERSGSSSR
jgi:RNA recognition motif-containing protein